LIKIGAKSAVTLTELTGAGVFWFILACSSIILMSFSPEQNVNTDD
jgi:hypothetical protein